MDWSGILLVVSLGGAPSAEEQDALVEACTRAFVGGTCVSAPPHGEAPPRQVLTADVALGPGAVADLSVRWAGDPRDEVRRELRFDGADTEVERAKAVGLTVGVLGSELLRRQGQALRAPRDGSRTDTREGDEPEAAPRERSATHAASPSLAALQLGVGWDEGLRVPESALAARVGWSFGPGLWAGLAGGVARSDAQVRGLSVQKLAAAAWAGWGRTFGNFEVLWGVDVGVERLAAASDAPLPQDRASRWVPLLGASASGAYWLGSHVGVLVTAQAGWALSNTRLWVRDDVVEHAGHLRLSLLVGPALRWDSPFE